MYSTWFTKKPLTNDLVERCNKITRGLMGDGDTDLKAIPTMSLRTLSEALVNTHTHTYTNSRNNKVNSLFNSLFWLRPTVVLLLSDIASGPALKQGLHSPSEKSGDATLGQLMLQEMRDALHVPKAVCTRPKSPMTTVTFYFIQSIKFYKPVVKMFKQCILSSVWCLSY